MKQDNVVAIKTPDEKDPLQAILREGARKLLREAIGAEVDECLAKHRSLITDDGSPALVLKTRAAILEKYDKPLFINEITIPMPNPDEAIVKLYASGICGSQLIYKGLPKRKNSIN